MTTSSPSLGAVSSTPSEPGPVGQDAGRALDSNVQAATSGVAFTPLKWSPMSTEQPVVITPENPKTQRKPADPNVVPAAEDLSDDDLESVAGGGERSPTGA